jgi:predicted TPR repeat methyltransferase
LPSFTNPTHRPPSPPKLNNARPTSRGKIDSYLLGVLREVEGKFKAAAEAYRDALRVDPNYEPAKLHLMKYQDTR